AQVRAPLLAYAPLFRSHWAPAGALRTIVAKHASFCGQTMFCTQFCDEFVMLTCRSAFGSADAHVICAATPLLAFPYTWTGSMSGDRKSTRLNSNHRTIS